MRQPTLTTFAVTYIDHEGMLDCMTADIQTSGPVERHLTPETVERIIALLPKNSRVINILAARG